MSRVVALLALVVVCGRLADSQTRPLSGELKYEHQYQDVLSNGALLTTLRMVPGISLGYAGSLVSPRFLFYTLRSSFTTSISSTRTPAQAYDSRQFLWNQYDVNLMFLQRSPVSFDVAFREYESEFKYEYPGIASTTGTREEEQRVNLSIQRVESLPTFRAGYKRTRSSPLTAPGPGQLTQQYTVSVTTPSTVDGSLGASGSLTRFQIAETGLYEDVVNIQLNGSRQYSERHSVGIGAEYNKYSAYAGLSGGIGYTGRLSDRVQINSGVSGQNTSSRSFGSRNIGFSQGVQWFISENWRTGVGGSIGTGRSDFRSGGTPRSVTSTNYDISGSAGHSRAFGLFYVTNSLSGTFGLRSYYDRVRFWSMSFANTVQRPVGSFALNASYVYSMSTNRNSYTWSSTEHFATFAANGMLPASIRSRTDLDYRKYFYGGNRPTAGGQETMNLSQTFESGFRLPIPFTVGAGGSIHWYFSSLRGRTFGWHLTFQSPSFIIRSLYASYRFSRTYDPYFNRRTLEHHASLLYHWRALTFRVFLRQLELVSRHRDVCFSVSRVI